MLCEIVRCAYRVPLGMRELALDHLMIPALLVQQRRRRKSRGSASGSVSGFVYLLLVKRCLAVKKEHGIIKEAKPDTFSSFGSISSPKRWG